MEKCLHETDSSSEIGKAVKLLQLKYISVQKILLQIDPIQADHFKKRNGGRGCCQSTAINIPYQDLTSLQRHLYQCTTAPFLLSRLNELFQSCHDTYQNVKIKGIQQKLSFTPETEKLLIDKILSQKINSLIIKHITQEMKKSVESQLTSIGLWATPTTWYQNYPNHHLDLFSSIDIANLFQKGYAYKPKIFQGEINSISHTLQLMQKDGRFQTNKSNQSRYLCDYKHAVSNVQIKNIFLFLLSIAFQINQKSNRYCTSSEDVEVLYYNHKTVQKYEYIKQSYLAVVPINGMLKMVLRSEQETFEIDVQDGSLLLISNALRAVYEAENIFLFRKTIHTLTKCS